MPPFRWRAAAVVLACCVGVAGCGGDGGDDDDAGQPRLPRADLIAPALEAVVDARGPDVELLEVAANLERVDVIVRDGSGSDAVLYRYAADDQFEGPIEPRLDDRATFAVEEVDVDADRVFTRIEDELPNSAILDLAIHDDGGIVVNDATVASESGGVLLVLLQADGDIVGMQEV